MPAVSKLEYMRNWRKNNPEKMRAYRKAWKLKNIDKVIAEGKKANVKRAIRNKLKPELDWQKNNREKARDAAYKWRTNNHKKHLAAVKHSGTIRKRLIGSQEIAKNYAKEIREIYKKCPDGYHVDHIVPLRGRLVNGLHVPWNLQYLIASENRYKANSHG